MLMTLDQKNGRNWRRITVEENGIQFEISNPRTNSSRFLSFRQLDRRNSDYTFSSDPEPQHTRNIMLLGVYASIALTFLFGAVADHFNKPSNRQFGIVFNVIAVISALSVPAQLFVYNRKITIKKIHFRSGGFLTVYYRNSKDIDQVTALELAIDKAYNAGLVKEFVEALKSDPTDEDLKPWLDELYEDDHITHKAYLKYKQQLKGTNNLNQTEN
jgi:hypothetical protein